MDPLKIVGKSFIITEIPDTIFTVDSYLVDRYIISHNKGSKTNNSVGVNQMTAGIATKLIVFIDKVEAKDEAVDNKNYFNFDDL